jgi:hypothetical protein
MGEVQAGVKREGDACQADLTVHKSATTIHTEAADNSSNTSLHIVSH